MGVENSGSLDEPQAGAAASGSAPGSQPPGAEAALNAEERLRIALEVGRLGIWSYAPAVDRVYWADNVLQVLGLPDSVQITSTREYQEFVYPDDLSDIRVALQNCIDGVTPDFQNEHRLMLPDGSVRWVEVRGRSTRRPGRPLLLQGTLADITARKQIEEALQSIEERLHMALEAGRVDVWTWNPATDEAFTTTYSSEAAGLPITSLAFDARSYVEQIHPDDRAMVAAAVEACTSGQASAYAVEYRLVFPDQQQVRWIEARGHIRIDPTGQSRVLMGTYTDITERKQLEEALRTREEQLHMALEAGQVDIWVWDLATGESYTTVYTADAEGLDLVSLGKSMEDYLARVHPEDREALVSAIEAHLGGATPQLQVEYRVAKVDGQTQWIETRGRVVTRDASGAPHLVMGTMRDITARKAAEAASQEQRQTLSRQARLMAQAENVAGIGGWEWDVAARALYWSPETYRIHDVVPEEFTPAPETVLPFYTRNSIVVLEATARQALAGGEPFDRKADLITAAGARKTVRITGRAEIEDGRVVRLYGAIQDVTQLAEMEEQLRQAQKMEAIGQLAGGVAHDFNNLLSTIASMGELAQVYLRRSGEPEAKRVLGYLDEIRHAGERAAGLTAQLLAFSRQQIMHAQPVHLGAVVTNMEGSLRQLAGEPVTLVTRLAPDLQPVMADPTQMEQVIVNLVLNARDAMPQGGTLTLELENTTVDTAEAERHMDMAPGPYVTLAVRDTGTGIPLHVLPHIFEPFFTTKTGGKGTGLGLATVYGIVRQCGGAIDVETVEGLGTVFRIYLPPA